MHQARFICWDTKVNETENFLHPNRSRQQAKEQIDMIMPDSDRHQVDKAE